MIVHPLRANLAVIVATAAAATMLHRQVLETVLRYLACLVLSFSLPAPIGDGDGSFHRIQFRLIREPGGGDGTMSKDEAVLVRPRRDAAIDRAYSSKFGEEESVNALALVAHC
jgi:hypothetical protein